jgi:hypothetical protein
MTGSSKKPLLPRLVPLTLVLVGWSLRLYGVNWDQGHGVHPDERYIAWVAGSLRFPGRLEDLLVADKSGLNPYKWPSDRIPDEGPEGRRPDDPSRPFSYGHFPLYLVALSSAGTAHEEQLTLLGRALSALFDTVTLVLVFAFGRTLYGAATGVLAAVFVTFAVLHLQQAHFATFDAVLTCFVVATLYFAARFSRHHRVRDAATLGLCLGLAVGSKFSAILLVFPVLLAFLLPAELQPQRGGRRLWALLGMSFAIAFVAFALTNPFALLQPDAFFTNLRTQGAMLRGDDSFPFTQQYHGTLPYVYSIEQLLRWGMGLPLGLLAFAGLAYAFIQAWRTPSRPELWIALAWVMAYFGFFGSLYVKFLRYMLPVSPMLLIFGAELLVRASRYAESCSLQPVAKPNGSNASLRRSMAFGLSKGTIVRALIVFTVVVTSGYAFAFVNVYTGEHPWLKLSHWIYANVPQGARIAHENWDHQLPLTLTTGSSTRWPGEFTALALDLYAPDTSEKQRIILEQLAESDYLVIASQRSFGSISRRPDRYRWTQALYWRLFDGQLGFRAVSIPGLVRHPRLGPVTLITDPVAAAGLPPPFADIPDKSQRATPLMLHLGPTDESFSVYDHPQPLLFENIAHLSVSELEQQFSDPFTSAVPSPDTP